MTHYNAAYSRTLFCVASHLDFGHNGSRVGTFNSAKNQQWTRLDQILDNVRGIDIYLSILRDETDGTFNLVCV